MEDWEKIKIFALRLLKHIDDLEIIPDDTLNKDYFNERLVILHLCQATELLMKSYLIKEGYEDEIWVNKGRRSISFDKALKKVVNKLQLKNKYSIIKKTNNKYRNEIQHLAKHVPDGKKEAIRDYYPALKELYKKMFDKDLYFKHLESY